MTLEGVSEPGEIRTPWGIGTDSLKCCFQQKSEAKGEAGLKPASREGDGAEFYRGHLFTWTYYWCLLFTVRSWHGRIWFNKQKVLPLFVLKTCQECPWKHYAKCKKAITKDHVTWSHEVSNTGIHGDRLGMLGLGQGKWVGGNVSWMGQGFWGDENVLNRQGGMCLWI